MPSQHQVATTTARKSRKQFWKTRNSKLTNSASSSAQQLPVQQIVQLPHLHQHPVILDSSHHHNLQHNLQHNYEHQHQHFSFHSNPLSSSSSTVSSPTLSIQIPRSVSLCSVNSTTFDENEYGSSHNRNCGRSALYERVKIKNLLNAESLTPVFDSEQAHETFSKSCV